LDAHELGNLGGMHLAVHTGISWQEKAGTKRYSRPAKFLVLVS